MERRIFGLENEYGVTCTFRGQRRLSPDEVARYLFRRVVHWGRSSNVFLENGARLYLDVGSHPEYATQLGKNGREHVKENFLMTTNVKRWLMLFRILEDAKASRGKQN